MQVNNMPLISRLYSYYTLILTQSPPTSNSLVNWVLTDSQFFDYQIFKTPWLYDAISVYSAYQIVYSFSPISPRFKRNSVFTAMLTFSTSLTITSQITFYCFPNLICVPSSPIHRSDVTFCCHIWLANFFASIARSSAHLHVVKV